MNTTKIQIEKIHLKLRGVSKQEAGVRAQAIAAQVAEALGRETALQSFSGSAIKNLEISLSQRNPSSAQIAEQVRRAVQRQTRTAKGKG